MCDMTAVEVILSFAIGGITLRALMALVKDWLKVQGLLAVLVAIAMCGIASAAYLLIVGQFVWLCWFLITVNVFTGTQVAYRATK